MYKPNFDITPKILDLVSKIASARELVFNAQLIPQWEISLRRDALLENAHASTSIEGNTLTMHEVTQLSLGRDVLKTKKERQEVLNYLDALSNIEKLTTSNKLSKEDLFKAHDWVVKDTMEKPEWEGKFREMQVFVGNQRTGQVSFVPPKPEEIEGQLNSFLEWLNSDNNMHPVIEAGIAHYEIARIHPFVDGNGRLARLIATWILVTRGFDIKKFFALDDYYNSDRRSYYDALKTVDRETLNITKWLEYFVEGVAVSINTVKEKVMKLSAGRRAHGEQIMLSEREAKIIEHANQFGSVKNEDVQNVLSVKRQVATKELKKLVEKHIFKKTGTYKDARYVFIDQIL